MFSPSDITVYVPFYNAGRTIVRSIDSLKSQTITPFEILIINDGSQEPLPELHGCRVVNHSINKGLACARNTAIKNCSTKLIASIDADVIVDPYWLENLLLCLNESGACGVAGRMDEFLQEGVGNQWRSVHMAQHWGEDIIENPRFLFGANTLFVRDVLVESGFYDENLRTNNEDRTMSEKIFSSGRKLVYTPHAKCFHLREDSAESILSGYWGWHHAKGLVEGDFDSVEGIYGRIGRVNFGISNYRYNLDRENCRNEFLALDLLIPYVFCCKDIIFYCMRNGIPVPNINALAEALIPEYVTDLLKFTPECKVENENLDWFDSYLAKFKECVDGFNTAKNLQDLDLESWFSENIDRVTEEI